MHQIIHIRITDIEINYLRIEHLENPHNKLQKGAHTYKKNNKQKNKNSIFYRGRIFQK